MLFSLNLLQQIHRYLFLLIILVISACASQRPPSLIPFDDGEYWVLGNELVFTIRETGQRIVVPRGFVTDFASVPRIFWTFFPKHGEYTRAAIVHDFLYWQQECSRDQADELFDIVMEDSEVDSTSRFTIYAAVRVWGDDAWEENSGAKQQGYVRIIPERYMNFPLKTRWEDYREFLRQMIDEMERIEEYPGSEPPAYCRALQEKEPVQEELQPQPVPASEPETASEPEPDEENEEVPAMPKSNPVLESAVGA